MADPVPPYQPPAHVAELPPEGGGGGATNSRIYFYQESLGRETTNTLTYNTKASITFTPNAGKTYAILWSALLDGNSTSNLLRCAIRDLTALVTFDELMTSAANASTTTNKIAAGGLALYTAPTPSIERTIAIRYSVSNAALVCGIQEARICIIELIDNVDIWASDPTQKTTTGDFTNAISIAWTPPTAGDYLTVASAHVIGGAPGIKARLYVNNTTAASLISGFDAYTASERQAYHGAYRHSNISGATTAALQWGSTNGIAAPILSSNIVSFRLDQFENAYFGEDRTQRSTTSSTYVDSASVTATPEAFPHLVLACANIDVQTDTTRTTASSTRIAVGGTGQGSIYAQQRAKEGQYRSWFQALVRTESASSTTWSTQYARTDGTTTARTDENVIAVLQLEGAGASTGATIPYVGAGTPAHADYTVAANPPLPTGTQPGDLLICFSHLRSDGQISSSWPVHTQFDGPNTYLIVSYRFATGSDTSPVITPTGAIPGEHHSHCVLAFRGVDLSSPFGTPGTAVQNTNSEDLGPIPATTAVNDDGVVIVFGARNDVPGAGLSSPGLLSGDGLNWIEAVNSGSVDNRSHIVIDYAVWSGGAPTLTAKTFDVPSGTPLGKNAGVMLILNPASGGLLYVGTGAVATGDHDDILTPALPAGVLPGDFLMAFGFLRNAGTLAISSGWTQRSLTDTTINGASYYLRTWYRFATGSGDAPTITIAGGSVSPQSITVSFVTAYRSINTVTPFASDGADSFNVTADDVGPIAVPATLPDYGAVLVFGVRTATVWTGAALLTGDGLTWAEDVDATTTLSGLGVSVALDHALWSGGAPTLTAKTFDVTGGAAGPGFGKMFALSSSVLSSERSTSCSAAAVVSRGFSVSSSADCVVAAPVSSMVGTLAVADHDDVMVPGLPPGIIVNDTLFAVAYLRNAGTLSISAGWAEHSLVDTFVNNANIYLQTWYCVYDGTQIAPTITTTGGSQSPQTVGLSFVVSLRGYNVAAPFAVDGADSFFPTQSTLGPISPPPALPADGGVLVLGVSHGIWTDVPTLTGNGLVWEELFDNRSHTVSDLSVSAVLNYATWRSVAPALTAKTFSPTGVTSAPGIGKMFAFNAMPVLEGTIPVLADALVSTPTSVFVGADAFVIPGTLYVQAVFDAVVVPRVGATIQQVAFCDSVVVRREEDPAEVSSVGELSAQTISTAWIVLLTLEHPGLPTPIRVTSDGVSTVSGGNIFSPFPFQVILPDDVEGRPPQAQLRIDNTTQEIIAELRNLTSPPKLTVQIVRSTDPNVVEYQWIGLEWSASAYDKSEITGTLTFADLSREEFPYTTFDSRWRGLWP